MMSSGTRPSGVKSAVIFGLVAFLTIAREPSLLVEPRFWAEEGTAFFQQAMSSDWHSLVWLPFRCNYFLFPRIATLLSANLLPLSYAHYLVSTAADVHDSRPEIHGLHDSPFYGARPGDMAYKYQFPLACRCWQRASAHN
jgi:hypothetical protein